MTGRRRAVAEFLLAALSLACYGWLRRRLRRRDDVEGLPELSPAAVAAGAGYQVASLAAHDRDLAGVRTNRRRRLLWRVADVLARRWLLGDDRHDFDAGGLLGAVLYRLWYGVLRPAPGRRE